MRRRLILTVLAVTAMVAVAFLVPLAAEVRSMAAERALAVADQESQSLAGVLASDPTPSELTTVVGQLNAGQSRRVAVYLPDGTHIGPQLDPSAAELTLAQQGRSFTAAGRSTDVWSAVRTPEGVSVAEVAVPEGDLRSGVGDAWLLLGLVGLLVVAAGVVLADRLGQSTVRPVQALGAVTRRLRAGDLTARVPEEGPSEVADVAVAVNELAERIVELLALERESAADLSHGLRTPLAALRLEAESISRAPDRDRITQSVAEVTAALDTLIRQVRSGRRTDTGTSCDLGAAVTERLQFWELLAGEQGRPMTVALPDHQVLVAASDDQLRRAFDALMSNVFAYTPGGSEITVTVELDVAEGEAVLTVADRGPGIDPGLVPERGRSGAGSTGLGLDIASRAALASGGHLAFDTRTGGGTQIRVHLGLAGSDRAVRMPLSSGATPATDRVSP